jgi:hypothetical protein
MNKLSRFLVIATAISSFLFAFSQRGIQSNFFGRYLTDPMLKPGEKIDDMVITTGAENAYPLSAFCSPTKLSDGSIRVDCAELAVCANLAIGETFGVLDLIPSSTDWGELTWELSVDGHSIDLTAFGVSDFVHPDLAPHPSRIREVFRVARDWNVVLVNPTPGMHTLRGQVHSRDGAAPYTWVVNFTVPTPRLDLSQRHHQLSLYK